MLEKLKYVNHYGKTINFGENGIFVNYNDLRDFSWDFESYNNRISAFSRGITKKSLPVIICCSSESEGIQKRNELFELAEEDVLTEEHGKIMVGDYYLKCYVTGRKNSRYLIREGYLETTLTIVTDYPMWVKEDRTRFLPGIERTGTDLEYPYDFAHDYSNSMNNKKLLLSALVPVDFELVIYGACADPTVMIAGHVYNVGVTLATGEYLVINSRTKKICRICTDGAVENVFHLRNRDSYIFQKIKPGSVSVIWSGLFGFDVTLYIERSEPEWT